MLNFKYATLIYGLISVSGLIISIFLMILNGNNSDFKTLLAIGFLGISIIPSIKGFQLGYKLVKAGDKLLGIAGVLLNIIVPFLFFLLIFKAFGEILNIFNAFHNI